jgi:hypothetical protein
MNINAIWALYSSIVPPRLINQQTEKIKAPHQKESDEVKEQKSAEAYPDVRGGEILRIINEIARGS